VRTAPGRDPSPLRERPRARLKRDPQPSAGVVVDSQSVKGTGVGGDQRGHDGAKKVKGGKRHLLVDTEGLVLKALLSTARRRDGLRGDQDAPRRTDQASPRLRHLWLDAGYRGKDKGKNRVQKILGWSVDLVERPRKDAPEGVLLAWAEEWEREGVSVDWQELLPPRGFQVLPRRWVVERTIAWIDHNGRMSKDYERLPETGEAFIYVAMSRLMARRLACS
jgi:putative transposase